MFNLRRKPLIDGEVNPDFKMYLPTKTIALIFDFLIQKNRERGDLKAEYWFRLVHKYLQELTIDIYLADHKIKSRQEISNH